ELRLNCLLEAAIIPATAPKCTMLASDSSFVSRSKELLREAAHTARSDACCTGSGSTRSTQAAAEPEQGVNQLRANDAGPARVPECAHERPTSPNTVAHLQPHR